MMMDCAHCGHSLAGGHRADVDQCYAAVMEVQPDGRVTYRRCDCRDYDH